MTQPLRLLQFSDTHLFGSVDGLIKGVNSYASLQQVLSHARTRHWDCDGLLLTGDIVHDDSAGYQHVKALFGSLGKPVYCLPGNHDDIAALNGALRGAPFQIGGHVDLGAWRIIMLDSVVPGAAHGALSPQELKRLEIALGSAGSRHALVCLHHHPVQMASRWLDEVRLQNSAEFFAIADRYPQLRAICWGHVHQHFDVRRKGVRLLAVPSTCAQFAPYSEQFAVDQSPPGYRRLGLHEDGRIDTDVVRVELDASALRAAG
jgi:3',5'-cyclic-AMP phosphodiesterase